MDAVDVSHWPPLLQYFFWVGAALAGSVMWVIGARQKAPKSVSDDLLRQDLEKVVEAAKTAAFTHADQVAVSMQATQIELGRRFDEMTDRLEELELDKRLRKVEELAARLEERVKTLMNQWRPSQ
jgi:hypothetical protein